MDTIHGHRPFLCFRMTLQMELERNVSGLSDDINHLRRQIRALLRPPK